MLGLNNFDYYTEEEVKRCLIEEYSGPTEEVNKYDILIAYEETNDYGSSSWFLLEEKETKNLFEVYASRSSWYSYEGQWYPTPTTATLLKSSHLATRAKDIPEVKIFIQHL